MVSEQITWLYVRDLGASRRFYRSGLGLTLVLQQSGCCILGVTDTAYVGLCERPPPRETPGLLLCFVVDDVAAAWQRLLDAGASPDSPPRHNPTYAITHAFVRDPDGHRIEVQRFDDPTWKAATAALA
jgi:catechol 2,3-dioxygenase-like lactoylglutathione lyase family enzyme